MAKRRTPAALVVAAVAGLLIVVAAIIQVAPSALGNKDSATNQVSVTQAKPVTCDVWVAYSYYPSSLADLKQKASAVVVARVEEVVQHSDIVTKGYPSQRILFEAVNYIEGDIGKTFRLWRSGTDTTCQRGDPPYQVGEIYLLFIMSMDAEPGTFYVPAPPARYQVVDGQLEPMREENKPFAEELAGKTVTELEQILIQAGEP